MTMLMRTNGFETLFDSIAKGWFDTSINNSILKHYSGKPRINVDSNKELICIMAEMPGVDEEDIDVSVEDGILSIKTCCKDKTKEQDNENIYKEFSCENFERAFSLPRDADKKGINASYKNGILKINVPLQKKKKSTKIKILTE